MSRTVICRKYARELPGLDAPPFPGAQGASIYERVSRRAWEEWQALQVMLINEKRLSTTDPAARQYLIEQRELFLDNGAHDRAAGYVPPSATEP